MVQVWHRKKTPKSELVCICLTLMLLVPNFADTKWWKKLKNDRNLAYGYSYECTVKAILWISTWQGLYDFQKSLHYCALEESRLSIGIVKYIRKINDDTENLPSCKSYFSFSKVCLVNAICLFSAVCKFFFFGLGSSFTWPHLHHHNWYCTAYVRLLSRVSKCVNS